jgi:phage-related holin
MKVLLLEPFYDLFTQAFSNKSLLLFSFSLTTVIAWLQSILEIKFLGFSLGILSFLTVIILWDLVTGLKAARFNNEDITSRKGYRTIDKLMSNFIFICFMSLLQGLLESEGYSVGIWVIGNFKILVFVLVFLWEFHSIGENHLKRYGTKPRLFSMLDLITKLIEKKVIEKIKSGEINKSTEENKIEENILDDIHPINKDENHVE